MNIDKETRNLYFDNEKDNDEKFNEFLNDFKEYIFNKITNEWDKLRISKKEKGDNENTKNMNAKQRSANDLFYNFFSNL